MRKRSRIAGMSLAVLLAAPLLGASLASAETSASTLRRVRGAAESWTALARSSGGGKALPRLSDQRVKAIFGSLDIPELRDSTIYGGADMVPLADMGVALNGILKRYLLAPGVNGQPDPAANEGLYQDEIATIVALMVDLTAAQVKAGEIFMASLPAKDLTPIRLAGQKGFKESYGKLLEGILCMTGNPDYRVENTRMIAASLGRNGRTFAGRLPGTSEGAIRTAVHELIARLDDREAVDGLTRFAIDAGLESR